MNQVSAWDQQVLEQTARTNRTAAFRDCLSVFASQLENGHLDTAEVAALFSFIHVQSAPKFDQSDNLEDLRSVLASQTQHVCESILLALTTASSGVGVGSPEFAAAVDLLNLAHLSEATPSFSLVDIYVSSVAVGAYPLSAVGITAAGAAGLLELARRSGQTNYEQFIHAVNEQQYRDQIAAGAHSLFKSSHRRI
jgi:hypothetical protein